MVVKGSEPIQEYSLLLSPTEIEAMYPWIREAIRINKKYGNLFATRDDPVAIFQHNLAHPEDRREIRVEEDISGLQKSIEQLRTDRRNTIGYAFPILRDALYTTFEVFGQPDKVKVNGRINSSTFAPVF
ncbi:MAG: hypothetical protein AABW61_00935, partial [Candidatus Aenigmatarchaeota archaeon]